MLPLIFRLFVSAPLFLLLVTSWWVAGAARAAPAQPAPASPQAGVVGNGDPNSCDELAVHAALSGGGSVTFNCGGPKQILIVHEQMITQPTTIDGGGIITLTGGLTSRLLYVDAGASLHLNRITLDSGATSGAGGGAMVNAGTTYLNQVVIQYSQTDTSHAGGAVFTSGPLFVDDSTFYKNTSGGGGAIYAISANAVVEINRSIFQGNRALGTAIGGGAIWVTPAAAAHLNQGAVFENTSEQNGGAVFNQGTFAAAGVMFSHNSATRDPSASFRGFGGAINSTGNLTLMDTYLNANSSRYGGGLFIGEAAVPPVTRLQNTYVIQNQAVFAGGGIYASTTTTTATAALTITDSSISGNLADVGGGLAFDSAAVDIFRSAIGENLANTGGGIGNSGGAAAGRVRIYDSTLYSNVITATQGGAISNQGRMELHNLTLEGNDSGLYLSGSGESLTMANTVLHNVALNCDGDGAHPTSLGGNFSGDASCGLGAVSGDVQGLGLDPMLAGLAVGPLNATVYFAPLPGSPLINAATVPCSAHDQLGAIRPNACDKGAVEFHGLLPVAYLPLMRRAP